MALRSTRLPELVVLSKRDLRRGSRYDAAVDEWTKTLGERAIGVLAVSSATGEGLGGVAPSDPGRAATAITADARPGEAKTRGWTGGAGEFETEHRVYQPVGEGGYSVEREGDGGFRVLGRGVELLFERHDLKNEEALAYLEQRLNEIGVVAALRAAGFEPGDDVRVGEHEFELHP